MPPCHSGQIQPCHIAAGRGETWRSNGCLSSDDTEYIFDQLCCVVHLSHRLSFGALVKAKSLIEYLRPRSNMNDYTWNLRDKKNSSSHNFCAMNGDPLYYLGWWTNGQVLRKSQTWINHCIPGRNRPESSNILQHVFLQIWMNIQNLISVSINLMAIYWGYTVPHGTPLLHVITHFQTNHLHVCPIFFMASAWRSQICSCENTSSGCGKGGRRSDLEASRRKTSGLIWTCWGNHGENHWKPPRSHMVFA